MLLSYKTERKIIFTIQCKWDKIIKDEPKKMKLEAC